MVISNCMFVAYNNLEIMRAFEVTLSRASTSDGGGLVLKKVRGGGGEGVRGLEGRPWCHLA